MDFLNIIIILIIIILIYKILFIKSEKETVETFLNECEIQIDGANQGDIIVKDDRFYSMCINYGELGFGESYMYGYWDSKNLYETLYNGIKNCHKVSYMNLNSIAFNRYFNNMFYNNQTIDKASADVQAHYNKGNDLYERMLDKTNMQYTCGFFQDTNDLETAQIQKLNIIAQKLNLKPGEKLLDIGCGWGNLINFMTTNYGVKGIGITISSEQLKFCKEKYKDNKNAEFLLIDYRNIPDDMKFDKIVSVGMFEHVGKKNFEEYFDIVYKHLNDDGLALIHTMGQQSKMINATAHSEWIDKYIFPGGEIPDWEDLSKIISKRFFIHDWHNFGKYYARTFEAWYNNINKRWNEIPNYNEEFRRMWNFYLVSFIVNFDLCRLLLFQILISKKCLDKLPRRDCLIEYD
jgi:cyclopropane-fatty-acyl-phospholipid synthase